MDEWMAVGLAIGYLCVFCLHVVVFGPIGVVPATAPNAMDDLEIGVE
jgi:hypothetical protein